MTKSTRSGLQISPYKRLLSPTLALLCLISGVSAKAAGSIHSFSVEDLTELSFYEDTSPTQNWSEVLGSMMARQNGHYRKCQIDVYCNMNYYREWFTYITQNGLQLKYNKDTFKLKQWRLNK